MRPSRGIGPTSERVSSSRNFPCRAKCRWKNSESGCATAISPISTIRRGGQAAKASIAAGAIAGSIHKVGAALQGQEACNGWTYWHVEEQGTLVLIDELRGRIRGELAAAGA